MKAGGLDRLGDSHPIIRTTPSPPPLPRLGSHRRGLDTAIARIRNIITLPPSSYPISRTIRGAPPQPTPPFVSIGESSQAVPPLTPAELSRRSSGTTSLLALVRAVNGTTCAALSAPPFIQNVSSPAISAPSPIPKTHTQRTTPPSAWSCLCGGGQVATAT